MLKTPSLHIQPLSCDPNVLFKEGKSIINLILADSKSIPQTQVQVQVEGHSLQYAHKACRADMFTSQQILEYGQ